jgi:hypothetical protein
MSARRLRIPPRTTSTEITDFPPTAPNAHVDATGCFASITTRTNESEHRLEMKQLQRDEILVYWKQAQV